jgi:hypothetical protein
MNESEGGVGVGVVTNVDGGKIPCKLALCAARPVTVHQADVVGFSATPHRRGQSGEPICLIRCRYPFSATPSVRSCVVSNGRGCQWARVKSW